MKLLIVVPNPDDWSTPIAGAALIAPQDYLSDPSYGALGTRIINLSQSYRYQSLGYYVSLLAAARGQRPMPSVATIRDLQSSAFHRHVSDELDELIQKSLAPLESSAFTLSIYFGQNMARRYERLCLKLFNALHAPLLRAYFSRSKQGHWSLRRCSAIPLSEVPAAHQPFLLEATRSYCVRPQRGKIAKRPRQYTIGMLVSRGETLAPSNPGALAKFIKVGAKLDALVDPIVREDYTRVPQYDAIFIRTTTQVHNYTFKFARLAEIENIPVIDDSLSILRCTNKVFLAELLARHNIATPLTRIVSGSNLTTILRTFKYPAILKQPDSSFSLGITKVDNEKEFRLQARKMLEKSDLIIAQEFLPTEFDWRIGMLAGVPLFACKYYMAERHWQIYNHTADSGDSAGMTETIAVENAPPAVLRAAIRSSRHIGNGLYGVDIKEIDGKPFVIEVNDNPSIDSGIEDEVLGLSLYERIIGELVSRVNSLRGKRKP